MLVCRAYPEAWKPRLLLRASCYSAVRRRGKQRSPTASYCLNCGILRVGYLVLRASLSSRRHHRARIKIACVRPADCFAPPLLGQLSFRGRGSPGAVDCAPCARLRFCGYRVASIVKVAMGCHTEPAAVHIAHVLQRLLFFQLLNFCYNLHDLPQKKITRPYRKKKLQFFFVIHTSYRKKEYTHLPPKKLHD